MKEHFIEFNYENVDGTETVIARVYGNDITFGLIDRVKDTICNYKNENEGKWDRRDCLEAAKEQLETEGYEVHWINTEVEICF